MAKATAEWVTLISPRDVYKFLSTVVTGGVNETDSDNNTRIDGVLDAVVKRFRGAISNAGRIPLSLQPKAVPPEAVQHVLILVVEAIISSMPQVSEYVKSDTLGWMIKASRDWLEAVETGRSVSYPTDPDTTALPNAVAWGDARIAPGAPDLEGVDLTTD